MKKSIIATTLIGIFLSFFSSCNPKIKNAAQSYEEILLEAGALINSKVDIYEVNDEGVETEKEKGKCMFDEQRTILFYKNKNGDSKVKTYKEGVEDFTREDSFKVLQEQKKIVIQKTIDDTGKIDESEIDIIELTKDSLVFAFKSDKNSKHVYYCIPFSSNKDKKCNGS